MATTPTTRATDIQRTIEQVNQLADELLDDTQKRVSLLRSLADGLARREHERLHEEQVGPIEFSEGQLFGGVGGVSGGF